MNLRHEKMRDGFDKWHVEGLPFAAAFHHLSSPDGAEAHDHPFGFTSHVLSGGYVEEVFEVAPDGTWHSSLVHRLPGSCHHVAAGHIHRIVGLPDGGCWTLVIAGPHERDTLFWRFDGCEAQWRRWDRAYERQGMS